ncbi:MAG TPA: choice-of-anchor tandem repeat GloVer-containing protein [Terriglobales bacterium]|nr:choice-of-anchor tandem repeat GloVer-containing protein [Terriglobales bacterium]
MGFFFLAVAFAAGQSQYQVLYSFGANGPSDGNLPKGKLVFDGQGNLYGTTYTGGNADVGTVFELSPAGEGQWTETILYSFCSQPKCSDGSFPEAGLMFDSAGNLYGTTQNGGTVWGTVFELSPPSQQGGPWIETVLHTFIGSTDGCYPLGKLLFDAEGNLYGTASQCGGGALSAGTVFELTPVGDGTWQEVVLHQFCSEGGSSCRDGANPRAGVAFDNAGNLYGTTYAGGGGGGIGFGTVYELSPSGGGWTESVLHVFGQNANHPMSEINMDESGNLYGTANSGGLGLGGVFKLIKVGGEWKNLVFQFNGQNGGNPAAGIFLASQKNLAFGTTAHGGNGGTVYEFDGVKETVLYSFCSQPKCADGSVPVAALIADTSGHLYGTTQEGGPYGQGVVFEITP